MEILIGRITADAKINITKNKKQVVNFTIAINDSFKPTGSSELKKVTTFVNCSYWIGTGIVALLKKGTLVELFGRIHVSAWKNREGEAMANLNLHVSTIKLHGKPTAASVIEKQGASSTANPKIAATEDLPF
ncbi:MAG TPA: single-stranded DNA-binding protein [Puia sp.]|jgi:single-strand DNA-binding protein|nr:single-stranded DNA-binding protein [Puia sp.]